MIRTYLREVLENVPESVTITNITDNGDNTYNVYCDTDRMRARKVAVISDTPNFNDSYTIQSATDTYIVISKTSGESITTFGTIKNYVNFIISSYKEAKTEQIQSYKTISRGKTMPLILCIEDINESIEDGVYAPDLTIYVITDIDINESIKDRESGSMAYLRLIEADFVKQLQRYDQFFNTKDYSRTELFYDSASDKQQNQLESYVDAIRLVPNLSYILKSC